MKHLVLSKWNKLLLRFSFIIIPVFFFVFSCTQEASVSEGIPDNVDFNLHIKPIISDRCFKCHGPDNGAREADLFLHTEEGLYAALSSDPSRHVIVPGDISSSEMIHRITSDDSDIQMPPAGSNLSLTAYEKALISRWIEQGAEWKPHWAFIPPEKSSLPKVKKRRWPRNEIDYFTLAKMEEKGLEPSDEASKEKLIRRLSFDLTGLPPTLEEIDNFINDKSKDAYEKVVDRLLASESFGERMASEWMDVARYSDTHGYQLDHERTMWPWRDWVIDAFNKNLSYDKFIIWQIGGDLLPDATYEQKLATGFNRNNPINQESGLIVEEYRNEYVADRTHTTSTAFQGITMECARCHDHKYDPISQEEYYKTFAFFNNVPERGLIEFMTKAAKPKLKVKSQRIIDKRQHIRSQINYYNQQLKDYSEHPDRNNAYDTWLDNRPIETVIKKHLQMGMAKHIVATKDNFKVEEPDSVKHRVEYLEDFPGGNLGDLGDFSRHDEFSISIRLNLINDRVKNKKSSFSNSEVGPILNISKLFGDEILNKGYSFIIDNELKFSGQLSHKDPRQYQKSYFEERVSGEIDMPSDFQDSLVNRTCEIIWDGMTVADTILSNVYEVFKRLPFSSKGGLYPWGAKKDYIDAINSTQTSFTRQQAISRVLDEIIERHAGNFFKVEALMPLKLGGRHNIVISYNGNSNPSGLRIFVDGHEQQNNIIYNKLTGSIINDQQFFLIYDSSFCQIDDFRIYERALSDLEIMLLSDQGSNLNDVFTADNIDINTDYRNFFLKNFDPNYQYYQEQLVLWKKKHFSDPETMIMEEMEIPKDTYILDRGVYNSPKKKVNPGTPSAIAPFPKHYPQNRLGYAYWLVDKKNPLTARVTVNRYWQIFFGNGIVSTSDDFGNQGSLPTHPELLDWLAVDFIENGWDLKNYIKTITMSSTYRQISKVEKETYEVDPSNIFLSRGTNNRLSAEMIRDHVLAISGLLNEEIGGPPVKPYQPDGLWKQMTPPVGQHKYRQSQGSDLHRRSLYTYWKRTIPPPSMITMDAAERHKCIVQRQATNTPLQALILMNDPQYVEASKFLAIEMLDRGGKSLEEQIAYGFRLATSRAPNERELKRLKIIFDKQSQFYMKNIKEKAELVGINKNLEQEKLTDFAALIIIANSIINLDEAVKKG